MQTINAPQSQTIVAPPANTAIASVSRRAIVPFMVLATLAFGPSAIRYVFETSSMAVGLAIICAALLGAAVVGLLPRPGRGFTGFCLVVAALVVTTMIHLVITSFWFSPDYARGALSLMLLAVSLLGATVCASSLFGDGPALERALYWVMSCFILVAVLGLLGLSPQSGLASERPLFPFTEPSHYAFTVMPFLAFICARARGPRRYAALILGALFAFFIKSLSLIVGIALLGVMLLPLGYSALLAIAAVAGLQYVDLSYFSQRIDLSQETTNLSALIYRQGWELVQQSFAITHGFGIGFQQLGTAPVFTATSDIIFRLAHEDTNIQDAGFTAAKVIAELGVFGLALAIAYVALLVFAVLRLRRTKGDARDDIADVFVYCIVIGYSLEFLVRGVGYFSGTGVFLAAALIRLYQQQRARPSVVTSDALPFTRKTRLA